MKYRKTVIIYRLTAVLIIAALLIWAIVIDEMFVVEEVHSHTLTDLSQLEYVEVD